MAIAASTLLTSTLVFGLVGCGRVQIQRRGKFLLGERLSELDRQ